MVATLRQAEGTPATWPDAPAGLSTAAAALPAAMVWSRIEGWIAYRYAERTIQWVAEGPGEWVPPLAPATIDTVEAWNGEAWEALTLGASPLGGYELPGCGPYRFTGTVGVDGADIPAAVSEAYTRLAEYMAAEEDGVPAGARTYSESVPDLASRSFERSPAWAAMAMQYSGAADLLRGLRRV